jgi:hypothetical protein
MRFPRIFFFQCVHQKTTHKMQTQQKKIWLVIILLAVCVALQRYKIQLKAEHVAIGAVLIAAALQSSHTMQNIWKKGGLQKFANTLDRKESNLQTFTDGDVSLDGLLNKADIAVEEVSAVGKATGVGLASAFKSITDIGKPKTLDEQIAAVQRGGLLGAVWDGAGSYFGF